MMCIATHGITISSDSEMQWKSVAVSSECPVTMEHMCIA